MPTRASKLNQLEETNSIAHRIVAQATATKPTDAQLRSQAASILGKLGASKGGKARAAALSKTRRAQIARKAAQSRWKK